MSWAPMPGAARLFSWHGQAAAEPAEGLTARFWALQSMLLTCPLPGESAATPAQLGMVVQPVFSALCGSEAPS